MTPTFVIAEGLVISRHGQTLEYFRRSGKTLQFSDIDNGLITTLTEAEFFDEYLHAELRVLPKAFSSSKELAIKSGEVAEREASGRTIDLNEIRSEKYKRDTLRRHAYIMGMKKVGITKGQLTLIEDEIPRIAAVIGDARPPSSISVACWMRRFDRTDGSIYSVTDLRAIRDKRQRRSAEHNQIILDLIDEYYLKRVHLSIPELYGIYESAIKARIQEQRALAKPIENPVSQRTLYRVVAGLNYRDVQIAHLGHQEARRTTRFTKGHLPGERALQYVEIDHALLDIYVVDDRLMIPLGRPWLTIFQDRPTGTVIGFFVSFTGPSVDSIFAALRHSLYPHDRANLMWPDIENVIPHGLAEHYVSDRGPDFLADRYRLGIAQLVADYAYCPERTPWMKGPVERFFMTLSNLLESMPGKTFRSLDKRKDYDPAKQAVCRFTSFVWILYKWIADVHNVRPRTKDSARPLELFHDSIAKYPPSYPRNPDAVETILGERHESKLNHDGIKFRGLNYVGSDLEDIYHAIGPNNRVAWHINTTNLGCIRVQDPRTGGFVHGTCSRPDYANGLSLFQHEYIRMQTPREERNTSNPVESYTRAMEDIRGRIGEEILVKENSTKKRLAGIAGINSEAILAGKERTVADPFRRGPLPPKEEPSSASDSSSNLERAFVDIPDFGWNAN